MLDDDEPLTIHRLAFNRGAIKPMECLREGWQLIKHDYWLFLGITLVGAILAAVGPMGLLLGPAMSGIYLCYLRQARGQRVSFGMLFEGFEHFLQSLVAAMLAFVPMFICFFVLYGVLVISLFVTMAALAGGGPGRPNPAILWVFLGEVGLFYLALLVVSLIFHMILLFPFLLIVDRGLTGPEALLLGLRAVWGNLGGVIGMMVLNLLLQLAGTAVFCLGSFFILPIGYAMITIAYLHVFSPEEMPELPEGDAEPSYPMSPKSEGIKPA